MDIIIIIILVVNIVLVSASPPMTCREVRSAIEADKAVREAQSGSVLTGVYMPICLEDGSYAPRQCYAASCHCVTSLGARLTENCVVGFAYKTNCECARDEHQYSLLKKIGKMYRCTPIGSYHPIQCTGSVCYCVDLQGQKVGQETADITRQDQLNCKEL